jgi:hypothetical protein
MAEEVTRKQTTSDPGGAHAKGYSSDDDPNETAPEADPVPLASGPNTHSQVRVPERDNHVQPTGRKELPDDEPVEI